MDENRDFETIYRLCAPLMGRYLRALGCPGQDVEDVIHDAFVKALLHIEDYRGYRDIGGAFGKSESWARVTFYRARQKMRQMLEERGE